MRKVILKMHVSLDRYVRSADGNVTAEIARMKQEPGKYMPAHGPFAQSLPKPGLIEAYRLSVHPVVPSGGLPISAEPMKLKLQKSTAFPSGAAKQGEAPC
jgi:hypothetical protein